MALGNHPSRNAIYGELAESTYRNGGTNANAMKAMNNYVFGDNNYSREAFAGLGIPIVSGLSLSAKDQALECNFDLDTKGIPSGNSVTFVAQYWESTGGNIPSDPCTISDSWTQIGTSSSEGSQSHDLTGLDNSKTYEVRVLAYNLWNNSGNHTSICPFEFDSSYNFTGIAEKSPTSGSTSQLAIKTSSARPSGTSTLADVFVDVQADGSQTGVDYEVRVNGNTGGGSVSCETDSGGTNPQALVTPPESYSDGDTVEARAKESSSSTWTPWQSVSVGSTPNCPL